MKIIEFNKKIRRKRRVSSEIIGTNKKPRISVYRSNKYIYAQAVDDITRTTIVSASNQGASGRKTEEAKKVGLALAKLLKEKKIETGVFDRGMYAYNGRVKALAEGLREGGLKI